MRAIEILTKAAYKPELFNLAAQIAHGKTLLVGEGNLSFSLSIVGKNVVKPHLISATTIETPERLSAITIENSRALKKIGVRVMHGVDATKLSQRFGTEKFDSIIFQFPHTGTRTPSEHKNPNFILVRDFLRSAKRQLTARGKVIISAVDNPHYRGAFQFEEAARITGFKSPEIYAFNPLSFAGYIHSMTLEDSSAIDAHKNFASWVFRL